MPETDNVVRRVVVALRVKREAVEQPLSARPTPTLGRIQPEHRDTSYRQVVVEPGGWRRYAVQDILFGDRVDLGAVKKLIEDTRTGRRELS
jgi:hypothetical protein